MSQEPRRDAAGPDGPEDEFAGMEFPAHLSPAELELLKERVRESRRIVLEHPPQPGRQVPERFSTPLGANAAGEIVTYDRIEDVPPRRDLSVTRSRWFGRFRRRRDG